MITELSTTQSIDPDNLVEGDLHISAGQLVLVTGTPAISQAIRSRLLFFKGEWFLDLREGVPYFDHAFVKNPDLNVLRSIFREVISGTQGVDNVPQVDLSLDTTRRQLTVSFVAVLSTGEVITSDDFAPFIIEV